VAALVTDRSVPVPRTCHIISRASTRGEDLRHRYPAGADPIVLKTPVAGSFRHSVAKASAHLNASGSNFGVGVT